MNETEKVYWSISEVSQMLNLSYSTLHYWEQEIKLLRPHRNDGGTRFYSANDIDLLRQILFMRDKQKMSIRMIKKKLADNKTDIEKRQQMESYLQKLRSQLLEIRASLN